MEGGDAARTDAGSGVVVADAEAGLSGRGPHSREDGGIGVASARLERGADIPGGGVRSEGVG